ncbi:MAG TPA: hypothetical protein VEZ11_08315 [Thermoanaerobaculia bacterium]|nr:hypothetical protein [Thermoanaerobaculia bacterium]
MMRVVWDHPEARWLPSRFRFAVFRLFAWYRFRAAATQTQRLDRVALAIDRDQSAVEQYSIAAWTLLTQSCYLAAFITSRWHVAGPWRALAVALTPFLAAVLVEITFIATGAVLVPLWNATAGSRIENNIRLNSIVQMAILLLASAYFAGAAGWVRPVAWIAIAVFAMNGAAAVVLFAMRRRLEALDREYGSPPCAG